MEPDPWARTIVLMLLNAGHRPDNQMSKFILSDLRFGQDGIPTAIVAKSRGRFKTHSDVVARLPREAGVALKEHLERAKPGPDEPILTRTWAGIRYRPSGNIIRTAMRAFAKDHNLPYLQPVYFRHFVKGACERFGGDGASLGGPARA